MELRFGDLVRKCGRPQSTVLWTDPKQDQHFRQAINQNRILTVIQKPKTKHKDYGRIGFHKEPHGSYLMFPRPLPQDDSRVIGINYQLLDEPEAPAKPQKPKPLRKTKPIRFVLTVIRTAKYEEEIEVSALNEDLAKLEAVALAEGRNFDLGKAEVGQEVVALKKKA